MRHYLTNSDTEQLDLSNLIKIAFGYKSRVSKMMEMLFKLKAENTRLQKELDGFELYKKHTAQLLHVENMYRGNNYTPSHEFLLAKSKAVVTNNNPINRPFLNEIENIMKGLGCIHTRNNGRWFSLVSRDEAIFRLQQYQDKQQHTNRQIKG